MERQGGRTDLIAAFLTTVMAQARFDWKTALFLGLAVFLSLFAAAPLFTWKTASTPERMQVPHRIMEFDKCFFNGTVLPRWVPDTYGGRGSPLFYYYAPAAYLFAEPFAKAMDYASAANAAAILFMALSSISVFLLAREFSSDEGAFVAAVLYAFAPYHLAQPFVRGAFSESLATAILPLAFLFFKKCLDGKREFVPLAACAYGLVVFSHPIIAVLATAFLVLWAGVLKMQGCKLDYPLFAAAFALGLGASAFYWLPAFAGAENMRLAELNVFPTLEGNSLDFSASASGVGTGFAKISWLVLAAAVAALFFLRGRFENAFSAIFWTALFFSSVFSLWLWPWLPLRTEIQFPWRLLAIVDLAGAVLAAMLFSKFAGKQKGNAAVFALLAVVAVAVAQAVPLLSSVEYLAMPVEQDGGAATVYAAGDWVTPELLKRVSVGLTYKDEYLPATARRVLPPIGFFAKTSEGKNATRLEERCGLLRADAVLERNGTVTLGQYWFPNWRARIDGKNAPVLRDGEGLVVVEVPAGRHVVEARFENTWLDNAGLAASVVSAVAMAWFLKRKSRQTRRLRQSVRVAMARFLRRKSNEAAQK